jgi:hypothetical protein
MLPYLAGLDSVAEPAIIECHHPDMDEAQPRGRGPTRLRMRCPRGTSPREHPVVLAGEGIRCSVYPKIRKKTTCTHNQWLEPPVGGLKIIDMSESVHDTL